ncbi:hypothetical protein IP87_17890 [beta proteobacterium AAP121]|nr:hypothetical protein IP80_10790 [beta proteobacterium AAP65]KPF95008.1 hypothetical protein IP87_17890 [beta proteobacterium AAP121]
MSAPTSPPPAQVTVSVSVLGSPDKAWHAFTDPGSIVEWNFASPDWCCPSAKNELREGGAFCYRMEARDGSFGFDFEGVFLELSFPTRIRYALGPDREVTVQFLQQGSTTLVSQSFIPESTHTLEQQKAGWQSILESYKKHVETAAAPRPSVH